MSKKTLKFYNIKINKKEFHKSKEPINLVLINVDKIVVFYIFKHRDDGFKYFTKKVKLLNRCVLFWLK